MKLQFQSGRLRLRLQNSELESLLAGIELHLALGPSSTFGAYTVRAYHSTSASLLRREHDVLLSVPRAELAELLTRLPSKTGLRWPITAAPEFEVVLEVDIRSARS